MVPSSATLLGIEVGPPPPLPHYGPPSTAAWPATYGTPRRRPVPRRLGSEAIRRTRRAAPAPRPAGEPPGGRGPASRERGGGVVYGCPYPHNRGSKYTSCLHSRTRTPRFHTAAPPGTGASPFTPGPTTTPRAMDPWGADPGNVGLCSRVGTWRRHDRELVAPLSLCVSSPARSSEARPAPREARSPAQSSRATSAPAPV